MKIFAMNDCDFSADDVEIGTAVREIMRLVQDAVDAERKERESPNDSA